MNNPIFQELVSEDEYFDVKSDEIIYLDLRATSGYVKEAEKLERNDSKINLHIMLKAAAKEKIKIKSLGVLSRRIFAYFN